MIFENPVVILLACYWLVVTKYGFLLVDSEMSLMSMRLECCVITIVWFLSWTHFLNIIIHPHNTTFIFLGKLEQGLYLNHNKKRKIQWLVGNWQTFSLRLDIRLKCLAAKKVIAIFERSSSRRCVENISVMQM